VTTDFLTQDRVIFDESAPEIEVLEMGLPDLGAEDMPFVVALALSAEHLTFAQLLSAALSADLEAAAKLEASLCA
jgi:hypothetical protein